MEEVNQQIIERYFAKAVKARDAGKHKIARRWFMRIVDQNPRKAAFWMMVAFCEMNLGNHSQALSILRRAERYSPKNGKIQAHIGRTQLKLNRPKLAERALRKSVSLEPKAPTCVFLNHALFLQNREMEGVVFLKLALDLEPRNEEVHCNLGDYYFSHKQLEKAETHFRMAIEIDNKYAFAYSELGKLLLNKKQYKEARRILRKSVRLEPDYYWSRLYLANANWQLRKLKETEQQYREALRILPDDPFILALYGDFLSSENKKLDEAEKYFRTAVSRLPGNDEVQYFVGKHYYREGIYDKSRVHLKIAARKGHKRARELLEKIS